MVFLGDELGGPDAFTGGDHFDIDDFGGGFPGEECDALFRHRDSSMENAEVGLHIGVRAQANAQSSELAFEGNLGEGFEVFDSGFGVGAAR